MVHYLNSSDISISKLISVLHFSFPPEYLLLVPQESYLFGMLSSAPFLVNSFDTIKLYYEGLLFHESSVPMER